MLIIKNYVWYPYNEDGLLIKDEEGLKNEVPSYYEDILLPNKDSLINRARKDVNNWWTLSEHRAWLLSEKPKLVSVEFGGSGSFAFDNKGIFVVERGHGWIPKKSFDNRDYYFYLALFSSKIFENILSIYSKQLAGGKWWDLSNKHTKNIPIPNLTSEIRNSEIYTNLYSIGHKISLGEFKDFKIIDEYLNFSFYKYE